MKLEQVMFSLRQELSQNSEKQARALKSLNTIKASMQKNKKELKPESQHYLQLQYDIETDKNKTIVSTLINLGQELPEIGPLIEDILKENNV